MFAHVNFFIHRFFYHIYMTFNTRPRTYKNRFSHCNAIIKNLKSFFIMVIHFDMRLLCHLLSLSFSLLLLLGSLIS